jgi:hypothetical protein
MNHEQQKNNAKRKQKIIRFKHIFKTLNTHFVYKENEERKKKAKDGSITTNYQSKLNTNALTLLVFNTLIRYQKNLRKGLKQTIFSLVKTFK